MNLKIKRKKLCIFLIGILYLITGCTSSYNKLLYNKKAAFYSYVFGSVQGKQIYAKHDADVYVATASCQKTISALLAYKTLGADYRYETKVYVTKKNRKIHNVIISFAGDPTLKTADLFQLLKPLKGARIIDKILLDATLFNVPTHSPNLMLDDLGTDYAQPVSSINIDKNLIIVTVLPTKIGRLAVLNNDAGYPIDSEVVTNLDPSSVKLVILNNRIKATGNICFNKASLEMKISPIDLDYYVLNKVKSVIKSLNIKAKIKIIHNQMPLIKKPILINAVKSESLSSIIPAALKISDNLVFDSLYLKIIHSQSDKEIKSWNDGNEIFKSLIHKYFSIDVGNAMFVDGSGLSRYNRIQPRKFFDILRKGYYVSDFVAALASPGEPGSNLAKRNDILRYVRAKTGNMSGISCLCGYCISGHPKAFVIVANNFAPPNNAIFPILDNFVNHYCGE